MLPLRSNIIHIPEQTGTNPELSKKSATRTRWTYVELQRLRPLSDLPVPRSRHVAPLVLEKVVASRSVAVPVERHGRPSASCGWRNGVKGHIRRQV